MFCQLFVTFHVSPLSPPSSRYSDRYFVLKISLHSSDTRGLDEVIIRALYQDICEIIRNSIAAPINLISAFGKMPSLSFLINLSLKSISFYELSVCISNLTALNIC